MLIEIEAFRVLLGDKGHVPQRYEEGRHERQRGQEDQQPALSDHGAVERGRQPFKETRHENLDSERPPAPGRRPAVVK
jgi:hypothetical protein